MIDFVMLIGDAMKRNYRITMMFLFFLLGVLVASQCYAQEEEPKGGPLLDALVKRIETKTDKLIEETKASQKLFEDRLTLFDRATSKINELVESSTAARRDRENSKRDRASLWETLRESIARRSEDARAMETIRKSLKSFVTDMQTAGSERAAARAERAKAGKERKTLLERIAEFQKSQLEIKKENAKLRKENGTLAQRFFWFTAYLAAGAAVLILTVSGVLAYFYSKIKHLLPT